MNLSKPDFAKMYDENGQRIVNRITEDLALSEQLTYKPAGNRLVYNSEINSMVQVWDDGRLWGFNTWDAPYSKMISYFTDNRVTKRAPSLISHVLRKIAIRFPNELERDKIQLSTYSKIPVNEIELILSEAKNDPTFTGDSGFQNKVRFDGSLTKNNVTVISKPNDRYVIKRK